jgi:hypothetical protein
VERVTGIEPASSAWEAEALPLDDTRVAVMACTKSSWNYAEGQSLISAEVLGVQASSSATSTREWALWEKA